MRAFNPMPDPLPTFTFSRSILARETIRLRRRQALRARQIPRPGLASVSLHLRSPDDDESDDYYDPPRPPPPPTPLPSKTIISQASNIASPSETSDSETIIGLPSTETYFPSFSFTTSSNTMQISNEADSLTISTTTFSTSTHSAPTSPSLSSTSTSFSLSTSSLPSSATATVPTSQPTTSALPISISKGNPERTAGTAIAALVAALFVFGIIYGLFRFCPPIRNRYVAWRWRRRVRRAKRLGFEEDEEDERVVGYHQRLGTETNATAPISTRIEMPSRATANAAAPLPPLPLLPPATRRNSTGSANSGRSIRNFRTWALRAHPPTPVRATSTPEPAPIESQAPPPTIAQDSQTQAQTGGSWPLASHEDSLVAPSFPGPLAAAAAAAAATPPPSAPAAITPPAAPGPALKGASPPPPSSRIRTAASTSSTEVSRPPSYVSHWTASGASWVANGFRLPERISEMGMGRFSSGLGFGGAWRRSGSGNTSRTGSGSGVCGNV